MAKTLILVHGRDFKPPRVPLEKLWREALRFGVERDHPEKLDAYDRATIAFVYYGDISNRFLTRATKKRPPPVDADVASRQKTLDALKRLKKSDFSRKNYERLPGKESLKEGVADTLGPILSFFHLSDPLIDAVAPDMREYWDEDTDFGSNVRYQMIDPLKAAMDRGDSICVVAHSLGTMIAYDTFWKFSHLGEYRPNYTKGTIDLFITLGSPLADNTVRRKVRGANIDGRRRYPHNIKRWLNIAAEDDFISHDGQVADDYAQMKKYGLVTSIRDEATYNLSVRDGKSNPHHEGGYLIDPKTAAAVAGWL